MFKPSEVKIQSTPVKPEQKNRSEGIKECAEMIVALIEEKFRQQDYTSEQPTGELYVYFNDLNAPLTKIFNTTFGGAKSDIMRETLRILIKAGWTQVHILPGSPRGFSGMIAGDFPDRIIIAETPHQHSVSYLGVPYNISDVVSEANAAKIAISDLAKQAITDGEETPEEKARLRLGSTALRGEDRVDVRGSSNAQGQGINPGFGCRND